MRERKIILILAIAMLVYPVFFALSGVIEAQAYGPEPTIYIDNLLTRQDPPVGSYFTTPYIWPQETSLKTKVLYIKIARAPQLNTAENPANPSDKTWSWQVRLSYDPAYFRIAVDSDIIKRNFLDRNKYIWNDPDGEPESGDEYWSLLGTYTTTMLFSYDNTAGTALFSCALFPPDPSKTPLPVEYFDAYAGPYAPDKGRHGGSYYDLPYTENNTQAITQPSGPLGTPVTVIDPNYNTMFSVKITMHTLPPTDYKGTFHLYDTRLWCYDGVTTYAHSTVDAYYAGIPDGPEFPLGIGLMIAIAPAIPIVYLWRIRKKRR